MYSITLRFVRRPIIASLLKEIVIANLKKLFPSLNNVKQCEEVKFLI